MKQLCAFKCLTVFILMFFMGTFVYGDTTSLPDPLELISNSKYYGKITKVQAAEIIEKCASKTYKALSIVKEDKFFMSVPKQTYAHPSGIRTTTKFKWSDIKNIELLHESIRLSYWSIFFGTKTERSLEIAPHTYDLADLALAAVTLTGLPLSRENEVPVASDAAALKNPSLAGEQTISSGKGMNAAQKAEVNFEESLVKLKDFYDKGLISNAVYEAKQKELLDRMLGK